jgi:ribosome-binding protein aMBF1 (putative translation factor)
MKEVTRPRRLTAEEAGAYDEVRQQIAAERPQITARIRHDLADRRRSEAHTAGVPTLGQRLRAEREARGLSQVSLAAEARISQGYLSQIEQDLREPTLSIAARLAAALRISLDDLALGLP